MTRERGSAEGPVTGFIAGTGTRQRRPHDTREGQEDADDDLHNSIFKTGSEGVAEVVGKADDEKK